MVCASQAFSSFGFQNFLFAHHSKLFDLFKAFLNFIISES